MNSIMCERLVIDTVSRRDSWQRYLGRVGLQEPEVLVRSWARASQGGLWCANIRQHSNMRVRLRPATDGAIFNGQTPGLLAFRRQGKLIINGLEWVAPLPAQDYEAHLRGPLHVDEPDLYMDGHDLERIAALPPRRLEQGGRVKEWLDYLDWRTALMHHDRAGAPYVEAGWDESGKHLIFRMAPGAECPELADFVCQPASSSKDPKRWRPASDRLPRDLEVPGRIRERRVGPGGCEEVVFEFSKKMHELFKDAPLSLPTEGFLLANIVAERVQLETQTRALNALTRDQGHHPALLPRLFGDAPFPDSQPLEIADNDPAITHLTPDQRKAAARIAGQDPLVLIQGPPGTGKTTTIVAATRLTIARGGSVLIASQSNLAVDNVLERLPRDPAVRPIRVASNPAKLEDSVVAMALPFAVEGYWLPVVREHVEALRRAVGAQIDAAKARARARQDLIALGEVADDLGTRQRAQERDRRALLKQAATLDTQVQSARDDLRLLDAARDAVRRIIDGELVAPPAEAQASHGFVDATSVDPLRALLAIDDLAARTTTLCRLCVGQAGANEEEVARLQRERTALAMTLDASDFPRLIAINEQIARLQGSAWAAQTRWMQSLLAAVPDLPAQPLISALQPSPDLVPAVDAFCTALKQRIADAQTTLSALQARAKADQQTLDARRVVASDAVERLALASDAVKADRQETEAALARLDAQFDEVQSRWIAAARDAGVAVDAHPTASTAQAIEPSSDLDIDRATTWQGLRAGMLKMLDQGGAHASLLERYLRMPNVVGATCHAAAKLFLRPAHSWAPFDVAIVDEVSKATAPELVQPALSARRVAFIGDPNQLQPVFRNRADGYHDAIEEGLIQEADFERFKDLVTAGLFTELFTRAPDFAKSTLTTQFRAHPDIMEGFNVFYDGKLKAGPGTENRQHGLCVRDRQGGTLIGPEQRFLWLDSAVGPDGQPALETQVGSSKSNHLEADMIVDVLRRLGGALRERGLTGETETWEARGASLDAVIAARLPKLDPDERRRLISSRRVRVDGRPETRSELPLPRARTVAIDLRRGVGVIALYGAQVRTLRRGVDKAGGALKALDMRVATVDRFQGGEASIVLVSLVRAPKSNHVGAFARDFRRINVALSRARDLLIVAGSRRALRAVSVEIPDAAGPVQAYRRVMDHVDTIGGRRDAARLLA